jgi:hypothetical protein
MDGGVFANQFIANQYDSGTYQAGLNKHLNHPGGDFA